MLRVLKLKKSNVYSFVCLVFYLESAKSKSTIVYKEDLWKFG